MIEPMTEGDQDAAELVERIAVEIFDGWLPDDPIAICCAVVQVCVPANASLKVVGAFSRDLLLPALYARLAAQAGGWPQ